VNKHIAKIDGVPIFGALWTCMDSRYIRAQALTLTKAHDERLGPLSSIARSVDLYGHPKPRVAFSDDPVKVKVISILSILMSRFNEHVQDKPLLKTAFPSLFENLTPIAAAHGLDSLDLPSSTCLMVLDTPSLVEGVLSSLLSPLDLDENMYMCVSLDAEWNVSRRVGVSIIQIAPHSRPDVIYIIPVR
jgi:hypothetical protein